MSTYLGHSLGGERHIDTGYSDIVGSFRPRDFMRLQKITEEVKRHSERQGSQTDYASSNGFREIRFRCFGFRCFDLVDMSPVAHGIMGRSDNFIGQGFQYSFESSRIFNTEKEELLVSFRQARPKSKLVQIFLVVFRQI